MDDCIPVYIVLTWKGEAIARATFWVIKNEPLPITWQPARSTLQSLLFRWPLFICRSPIANTAGIILPTSSLRGAALATIIATALEQAHHFHCSFIIFDYLSQQLFEGEKWPVDSIHQTVDEPGSQLEIVWSDFESYLRSLSLKSRKNYRRYQRYAESHKIVIQSHDSPVNIDQARELILNVDRRFHQTPNPWYIKLLNNFPINGGDMLTARIGEKLVGCELLLRDGDEQLVTALGLDYSEANIYFLLNFADLRMAIESGTRILHWGSGAFKVKERLGFQFEHNNHAVFLGVGKLARLIGLLATKMN